MTLHNYYDRRHVGLVPISEFFKPGQLYLVRVTQQLSSYDPETLEYAGIHIFSTGVVYLCLNQDERSHYVRFVSDSGEVILVGGSLSRYTFEAIDP